MRHDPPPTPETPPSSAVTASTSATSLACRRTFSPRMSSLQLSGMKVPQLKALCRTHKLLVSVEKGELVARLSAIAK